MKRVLTMDVRSTYIQCVGDDLVIGYLGNVAGLDQFFEF